MAFTQNVGEINSTTDECSNFEAGFYEILDSIPYRFIFFEQKIKFF